MYYKKYIIMDNKTVKMKEIIIFKLVKLIYTPIVIYKYKTILFIKNVVQLKIVFKQSIT
jgi:hypothetical protein